MKAPGLPNLPEQKVESKYSPFPGEGTHIPELTYIRPCRKIMHQSAEPEFCCKIKISIAKKPKKKKSFISWTIIFDVKSDISPEQMAPMSIHVSTIIKKLPYILLAQESHVATCNFMKTSRNNFSSAYKWRGIY